MTWKRKTFVDGQLVEVQREASYRETWETAKYVGPSQLKGWHRVQLLDTSEPVTINVGDVSVPSHTITVPARRIRHWSRTGAQTNTAIGGRNAAQQHGPVPPPRHPEDSDKCDECDGSGHYYLTTDGGQSTKVACICSEPQE